MATAFENLAPRYIKDLMKALNITAEQAAGIVGNGGAESGLIAVDEKKPTVPGSRGGYGHFQWTGPRRVAFEKWCVDNKLDKESYEANFGFLIHELQTTEKNSLKHLVMTKDIKAAAETFGYFFLRFAGYKNIAGNKNYENRVKLSKRAYDLFLASIPPISVEDRLAALEERVAKLEDDSE